MDRCCGRQHTILFESVSFLPWRLKRGFLPACQCCSVQTCLCEGRVFVTCLPEALSVRACQWDVFLCGIVQPQALLSLYLNIGLKTLMFHLCRKTFSRDYSFKLLSWSPFKDTGVGFLKQWAFNKAFVTFGKTWATLYDLLWIPYAFLPQISKHRCWCKCDEKSSLNKGNSLCEAGCLKLSSKK